MAAPPRARRARGEPASPDPGARVVGNLRGAPVSEAFLRFAPIDDIPALRRQSRLAPPQAPHRKPGAAAANRNS